LFCGGRWSSYRAIIGHRFPVPALLWPDPGETEGIESQRLANVKGPPDGTAPAMSASNASPWC